MSLYISFAMTSLRLYALLIIFLTANIDVFGNPPDTLDHFPSYRVKGGAPTFYKAIQETLIYPRSARQNGTVGTAIVSMVLSPTGVISDFQIVNSLCKDIDQELEEVFLKTKDIWLADSLEKNDYILFIPVVFLIEGTNYIQTRHEAGFMLSEIKVVAYGSDGIDGRVREDQFHAERADESYKKKKYKATIKHLDELIRRNPFNAELYKMRAFSQYGLGNRSAACEDYRKLKVLLHRAIPKAAQALCKDVNSQ